jgi:1,4-dihydroxy-2-naphthoyl-CoA hydrolase
MATHPIPYTRLDDHSAAAFNRFGAGHLPGHLGIEVVSVEPHRLVCRVSIRAEIMAPNGYLHGGTPVAIADTLCGYGCITNLPAGATGFTTIELKTNFLATTRTGALSCEAKPLHIGRSTQIWDATVSDEDTQRVLATFRCTQLLLFPRVALHEAR